MHTSRVTVAAGVTLVYPVDYFTNGMALAVYPGTSTVTVTYTIDDVQLTTPAPVYFPLAAPFNVGVTANTIAQLGLTFFARALKVAVAGGTTADFMVLQPSGYASM